MNRTQSDLLTMTLNGEIIHLQVEPTKRLVHILREDLDLTGTKVSCEVGRCGACIVLIDNKPYNACLTMAYQCEGQHVQTIEGLGSVGEMDEIQQAFLEEGGFQCGYCTSGMIMAAKGVTLDKPQPSLEELKEGLCGNLCRCTGYGGILRALERIYNHRKK